MTGRRRWVALAVGAVLLLGACTETAPPAPETGAEPSAATLAPDPREDGASALDDMRDPAFPAPLIDPDQVRSGGPPPDGIPAIDKPRFVRAGSVDWLGATEPVLSLTVDGETRAYPLQVMTWHEIVNDTVGGVPVAVTYCPLCNSGVAFRRRAAGRLLSFGTSGRLYAGNLVMYDRQTESLWPQLTGQASIGVLTGTQLEAIPMGAVGWATFKSANPDALVLSRDTGFERPYGRNPYVGYDAPGSPPPLDGPGPDDPRLSAKTRVVGLAAAGEQLAIARERLARDGITEVTVGGRRLVVFHTPGQSSALDEADVADGADIGNVAVYRPRVHGRSLRFLAEDGGFTDTRTGSRWDVLGRAVAGPLAGARLHPVAFLDTFWFAWVAFHPDTRLLD